MLDSVAVEQASPDHLPQKQEIIGRRSVAASDRIVNQDMLVRKGLRAMPSRLRRSESKPLGIHWELLMQVPKVADDSQHLVDCCHSCSRECGRLLPDRWHIADKDCSHASPTA